MRRRSEIALRIASNDDFSAIKGLLSPATARLTPDWELPDHELIQTGCLLLAEKSGQIAGLAAIDPERQSLQSIFVQKSSRGMEIGRRLLVAAERRAVCFGILELSVSTPVRYTGFFTRHDYQPTTEQPTNQQWSTLQRRFPRRQTRYGARIAELNRSLGVPPDYARSHRLPLQHERSQLLSIGPDLLGRDTHLSPMTARAWQKMQTAAMNDEVWLEVVSGFRSVAYQASIVERKLSQGQTMTGILKVTAAPGFSEHHTGKAIDVSTPGFIPLEQEFEDSDAFAWLSERASAFGFHLSYPRKNLHRLAYEPWHWCYRR